LRRLFCEAQEALITSFLQQEQQEQQLQERPVLQLQEQQEQQLQERPVLREQQEQQLQEQQRVQLQEQQLLPSCRKRSEPEPAG
jgi:hypothetical protein